MSPTLHTAGKRRQHQQRRQPEGGALTEKRYILRCVDADFCTLVVRQRKYATWPTQISGVIGIQTVRDILAYGDAVPQKLVDVGVVQFWPPETTEHVRYDLGGGESEGEATSDADTLVGGGEGLLGQP